jgi:hypothetical protein
LEKFLNLLEEEHSELAKLIQDSFGDGGWKFCPTQRAPDWWESARFQAVCLAWSWFRQNGVVSSRPPAGNASR